MGSDRARISYDPSRDYRSVVAQQGRVTLEADVNEQAMIGGEALRVETIDVVGPAGTPDNGYQVVTDGQGNLSVKPGTMYVGGWRLELDKEVSLADQPDWVDQGSTNAIGTANQSSLVALLVTEQSISATEDQALLEVALGGPDTAARNRLMQHFVQIPVQAGQCGPAEDAAAEKLKAMGLIWRAKTLELDFNAGLKVDVSGPPSSTDPCCPSAQGGYLGSDNQLVQVTVSSLSGTSGTLLWGWNNASFLYRAAVVSAGSTPVLKLSPAPVDAAHTPQPNQVIELLRTTAVFNPASDDNDVAALQGQVITLGPGTIYDSTSQELTLPAGTTLPKEPHTLFVRLWQATVPFTSGVEVPLDNQSGISVTVKMSALPTAPLVARPYWSFAVRPNTPQNIYPQRYSEGFQPPEGPRQWLCPLAVFTPGEPAGPVTPDCRLPFLPLTKLKPCDCCELVLNPSEDWLGKLNNALASDVRWLNVCFQAGEFKVTSKILVSKKLVKMTGAGAGTLIGGEQLEAVLEFDNCPSVTLADLYVVAGASGYSPANGMQNLQGAITTRDCTEVNIERVYLSCADNDLRSASCLYVYNTPPATGATQPQSNVRVVNSRFNVGNCQVGMLVLNANRAQLEGNYITSSMQTLGVTVESLSSRPYIMSRLRKLLVNEMTIIDTAPPTAKQARRQLKKKKAASTAKATEATHGAGQTTAPAKAPAEPPAPETGAPAPTPAALAAAAPHATAPPAGTVAAPAPPKVNLGAINRSHVTATYGTFKLQFISSQKLTNAWSDALAKSGLGANSTMGAIHTAVKNIAETIVSKPATVAQAFRNYLASVLPQLYSTSSQGIVVAGNVATDIRIMNNTVQGTVQGIHVALNDMKSSPVLTDQRVNQVQICGNTVNLTLTPQSSGDRHGIYLGGVTSGLISDNNVSVTYTEDANFDIYAIRVQGSLGPRVLIERNYMLDFAVGMWIFPNSSSAFQNSLWKASDNWANAKNYHPYFISVNNLLG